MEDGDDTDTDTDTDTSDRGENLTFPADFFYSPYSDSSVVSNSRYDPVPDSSDTRSLPEHLRLPAPIPPRSSNGRAVNFGALQYAESNPDSISLVPENFMFFHQYDRVPWYDSYGRLGQDSDDCDEDNDLVATRVRESLYSGPIEP